MDNRRSISLGIGPFLIIAVQIGGFVILWGKDAPPPEYVYLPATTDKMSTAPLTTAPVVVVSPPDEKALREIIKTILVSELTSYLQHLDTAQNKIEKSVAKLSPVKENSPENIKAYTEASNIVSAALAAGRWSPELNFEMQAHNKNLTPEQHRQLLDQVGLAIMNKQIVIDGNNFPIF